MNLEELNERQREAVLYNDGPLLIIAGAGAGKTKTLTTKIAYLIEKKNVAPENILAITFTNKAAKEMKDRLFKTIGQTAKYLQVSTFHSFGLKLLRENYDALGYDKNFVIMDSDDSLTVIIINHQNLLSCFFEVSFHILHILLELLFQSHLRHISHMLQVMSFHFCNYLFYF